MAIDFVPSCVYCGSPADAREHWLPRALGTFGDLQVLRDAICSDCNRQIGREADFVFLRTGPEATHRAGLGIEGRRGEGGSPYYHQAATTQPVQVRYVGSDEDDSEVLWETFPGESGEPQGRLMQQLVIVNESGRRRAVPFNLEWSPDVLRHALATRGVEEGTLSEIYLDPEDLPRAREVLRIVFPGFSAEHFARSGAGQTVRRLGFWNTVNASYFRGVAKICFHGALRLVDGLDGHAWEFDVLRRFIRYGERPASNPVTQLPRSLVAELGMTLPRDRGHVFVVEVKAGQVFAKVQLFVSATLPEGSTPPSWQVRLGRTPGTLDRDIRCAYFAGYLSEPHESGHTGEIVPLAPARERYS